jgi:hypothetical protein
MDLAATFCDVALSTKDTEKKERNRRNARTAYASALHFLQRLSPGSGEHALIRDKVSQLNVLLKRLDLI